MKTIALIAGGLVVANVATNVGARVITKSGGSAMALAHLAAPYFLPAPVFVRRLMKR